MEGPSIRIGEQHLKPISGERVLAVVGNSKLHQAQLHHVVVQDILTWGKRLVIQFGKFALRTHLLMFGTCEADVRGLTVTGDHKLASVPRPALTFAIGKLRLFNCSVKFLEERKAQATYDLSIDIMARSWNTAKAMELLNARKAEQIADVLMDRTVFAGVGNIIKNEVLSLERINPMTPMAHPSLAKRKALIARTRSSALHFLRWLRLFALRKDLRVHRQHQCPHCSGPVRCKGEATTARSASR